MYLFVSWSKLVNKGVLTSLGRVCCDGGAESNLGAQTSRRNFKIGCDTSWLWKLSRLGHLSGMPSGYCPVEVFLACPPGRSPWSKPKTCWRDYRSHLAWEFRWILLKSLEVPVKEEIWGTFFCCPDTDRCHKNRSIDRQNNNYHEIIKGHNIQMKDNLIIEKDTNNKIYTTRAKFKNVNTIPSNSVIITTACMVQEQPWIKQSTLVLRFFQNKLTWRRRSHAQSLRPENEWKRKKTRLKKKLPDSMSAFFFFPRNTPVIDFHIKRTFTLTVFPDAAQKAYRLRWTARHHRCILNHQ